MNLRFRGKKLASGWGYRNVGEAKYTVEILPCALRDLQSLPRDVRERIRERIDLLVENPRPHGVKSLQGGQKGYLRIRVGDYRVIYRIENDHLVVMVVAIGHRREIYR